MRNLPHGLSTEAAKKLLTDIGPNSLTQPEPHTPLYFMIQQVKSPLVYVLLCASLLTALLGEFVDTGVILSAVFVNTMVGFFQERKAERALFALKTMLTPKARVVRDGRITVVPASTVVPGDVVMLSPGDKIPADGELIEAVGLLVDESITTGESTPVKKNVSQKEKLFMGTIVARGRGSMNVTVTGMGTEVGKIAGSLQTISKEVTPLQREIRQLGRTLSILVVFLSAGVFVSGLLFGEPFISMLKTSVAVAVSAIPEGMAVSLTVILALGMQRIFRKHALVRRLVAAETLGSVTTICVDKTGTITQGVMKVLKHEVRNPRKAWSAAIFANNLEDPLEIALWDWARAQDGIDPEELVDRYPRIQELPFDTDRNMMAVGTQEALWVKGAPEVVLSISQIQPAERKKWLSRVESYGKEGLRVIALAAGPASMRLGKDQLNNLEFLGLLGISDPVRKGVKESIARVMSAGISVKLVTGDYRHTAESVLRQIGIPLHHPDDEIIEGHELEKITEEELLQKVRTIKLFCRVNPTQKLKIVTALQRSGEVVAMTGDGVNDAMALKQAEIGIVVEQASDVAKETADLVLLDSNFRTIVDAIEEGRGIFDNIKKVISYLLSDACTEMVLIISAIFLRLPLPMTARQILWINIISDGFPNLAITAEPKDSDVMKRPPNDRFLPLLDTSTKLFLAFVGIAASFVILIFYIGIVRSTQDIAYARTLIFAMMGMNSLLYAFSCRNVRTHVFEKSFFQNPWLLWAVGIGFLFQFFALYQPGLRRLFQFSVLTASDWGLVLMEFLLLGATIEIMKYVLFRHNARRDTRHAAPKGML